MLNLLVAFLLCFQDQEPQFPANQGAINDFANIMSEEDKTKLRNECAALRDAGGARVVVVTTPSLYGLNVEDYANQLFKKWGIGTKKDDNGLLILIAPTERKCRIEVGYGNESRLTDLEAKAIITDVIRPLFRAGKISESVVAGTEAVLAKLAGTAGTSAPPTPVAAPSSDSFDGWILLGLPFFIWCPLAVILAIFVIWLLVKTDILDGFGGGGYYGGGGGGWGGGGGGSSSSDSSSYSGGGESSSGGGGDSGGGGASGDL